MRTKEESQKAFNILEKDCREQEVLILVDEELLQEHSNYQDFILDFLLRFNYLKSIDYTINFGNSIQDTCSYSRNRSLGDIYRILLEYYPETTLEELARFLFETVENDSADLSALYCPDVHNIVFYNNNVKEHGIGRITIHCLMRIDYIHNNNITAHDFINIS